MPKAFQAHRDRAVAGPEHRIQIHTPACDGRSLDRVDSARCKRRQTLLHGRQRACPELTVGPVQLQREGEFLPPVPRVLPQQRRAGGEIRQRGGVGRRHLRALAGDQVQLGDPLALVL